MLNLVPGRQRTLWISSSAQLSHQTDLAKSISISRIFGWLWLPVAYLLNVLHRNRSFWWASLETLTKSNGTCCSSGLGTIPLQEHASLSCLLFLIKYETWIHNRDLLFSLIFKSLLRLVFNSYSLVIYTYEVHRTTYVTLQQQRTVRLRRTLRWEEDDEATVYF